MASGDLTPADSEDRRSIIEKLDALGKSTESKKLAAKELGMSLATLYRKMKRYDLR